MVAVLLLATSCKKSYNARKNLSNKEYQLVLLKLAPYVLKKHDDFSFEDRFKPANERYYRKAIEKTSAELKYFVETDTANIFFLSYRDLSSLYEHYQGMGGYYRTDDNGNTTFLNILYHTPRFTKEDQIAKDPVLFKEMVTKGNVNAYIGNRKYIQTPSKDFFYNAKLSRWDYTANSSWKFLQEEEKKAVD
jgi:hypothetical protein